MQSDGTNQEQLTFDDNSNWFAHPSPDNKWIVFISYLSDEKQNHLFGKHVQLKLMNIATKQIQVITQFSMEVKALSMSHLGVQIVEK
jgi:Tol biopolymer transport system component